MERGTFIVIEGTDGSGKGTQFKLLADYLGQQGYDVATFDFPQYDQPSSYFVKKYLNGDYGTVEQVGPYTASLFYALDRYEAAPAIRTALDQGNIVLANRFTGSNMGHQGTKFAHAEERRGYFIWLDNLEFEMLKIPRPTLSLVLRVPAEVAQSLVDQKETRSYTDKKRDLHEADLTHMQRAVAVYDDLCQLFPKDFQRIDCVRGGELLAIETIHELVRQKVEPLLPPPPPKQPAQKLLAVPQPPATEQSTLRPEESASPDNMHTSADKINGYYIPATLSEQIKTAYRNHMDEIFRLHAQIEARLTASLDDPNDKNQTERISQISRAIIPVAALSERNLVNTHPPIELLAQEYLPANHSSQTEQLRLTGVSPRNELDLVSDMLYASSNLALTDIRNEVSDWPYEKRLAVFEMYLRGAKQPQALEKAIYNWDVLCDIDTFQIIRQFSPSHTQIWQELTPRYGFEVPKQIEEANVVDAFEQCFEISLKLHSLLHGNGYAQEAQYTTLLGHNMRWQLTLTASETLRLFATKLHHPGVQKLQQLMHQKLSEIHPILGQTIQLAGQLNS